MFSQLQCVLLPAVISLVVGDYHTDLSGQAAAYNNYNTYYPDYSYAYNNSVADSRKRRVFTSDYTLSKMFFSFFKFSLLRFVSGMAFTIDLTIPIPDLSSEVLVTVPFSVDFPTSSARSFSGRSFSSALESPRASMYKYIEKYMSQVTGADGHACLLRAMCEASSTPLHDEGILGDAVNFLLTAYYASEENYEKFKKYLEAQPVGQVSMIIHKT